MRTYSYASLLATLYWITPFLTEGYNGMIRIGRRPEFRGVDQTWNLYRGRRVSMRILPHDEEHADTIIVRYATREARGFQDGEIAQFMAETSIPQDAARIPAEGSGTVVDDQGVTWHYVAFKYVLARPPAKEQAA